MDLNGRMSGLLLAGLAALLPGVAVAEDVAPADEESGAQTADADPLAAAEQARPGATGGLAGPQVPAQSLTPPEGVMPVVRRGVFVETDVGVFFTLGGAGGYSNAQTYLQLGLGYDLADRISLGAHFGLGSNAANCFGGMTSAGACLGSDNFTLSFVNLSAAYLLPIGERLYVTPKLLAGWTVLDPAPVVEGSEAASQHQAIGAPNAGVGVGVEYATFMDHFSVGADLAMRYVVGPNIPTFAIFPRVKYTF